jgi:hypothetical protein
MSYFVKETENKEYVIVEKDTDVEIEVLHSKKETYDIARKLNLGSGFNGWTPSFFAKRITDTSVT